MRDLFIFCASAKGRILHARAPVETRKNLILVWPRLQAIRLLALTDPLENLFPSCGKSLARLLEVHQTGFPPRPTLEAQEQAPVNSKMGTVARMKSLWQFPVARLLHPTQCSILGSGFQASGANDSVVERSEIVARIIHTFLNLDSSC